MITRMSQSYPKLGWDKTVSAKKTLRCSCLFLPLMAAVFAVGMIAPKVAPGSEETVKTYSPAQAKEKQKQRVTVRFRVRGTGLSYRSEFIELYSEHRWENPNAFFVRIPQAVKKQLAATGISDIARHFYGRRIDATGTVERVEFGDISRNTLIVQNAENMRLVVDVEATPSDLYERRTINGFPVVLHPALLAQESLLDELTQALEKQLGNMTRQLPPERVSQLQKTEIWVELNSEPDKVAVFHRSPDWIVASDGNQDKLGHIEIVNAQNFVDLSRRRPSILFHHFAHAYHDKVLGADKRAVAALYEQVQLRNLYDNVAHESGSKDLAFATLDPFEYFAELTEAYFGRNDFFPFNRSQLKKHDPAGHDLIGELWLRTAPSADNTNVKDATESAVLESASGDADDVKTVTGE